MTAPGASVKSRTDNARRSLRREEARAVRSSERARRAALAAQAANGGGRPFQIPRCAACSAPLSDAAGEPRWDLLEGRFVCLGRCAAGARRG